MPLELVAPKKARMSVVASSNLLLQRFKRKHMSSFTCVVRTVHILAALLCRGTSSTRLSAITAILGPDECKL